MGRAWAGLASPGTSPVQFTMAISLKESQALAKLSQALYGFLPGKPHPMANPAISFEGAAKQVGLGQYWSGGSKLPAIQQLLQHTLENRRGDFCRLVTEIVRRGMSYRNGKQSPLTREEVATLNNLIAGVGFKIPDLHDPAFISSLPSIGKQETTESHKVSPQELKRLETELLALSVKQPQERGFLFETFLNDLFAVHGLAPKGSFRLKGEQIDGSFHFQTETYLLEAKWIKGAVDQADLLVFSGKVGGKAAWSRGLFVTCLGFSDDGLVAFSQGRQTNIICMDGLDLYHVLQGKLDLRAVLQEKARRAAETNRAFVPVRDLFPGLI